MIENIHKIKGIIVLLLSIAFFASCSQVKGPVTDEGAMRVTCYDADKGDAFLISSTGFNMMIDCGRKNDADEILSDLKGRGIRTLDALIITHFDKDHVGGAAKIVKNIRINRIITTYRTNDDKRTVKFFDAMEKRGLSSEVPSSDIEIGNESLSVLVSLPGKASYPDDEDNNSSLTVMVRCEGGSMFFAGDAVKYRMDEILSRNDLDADVLKVPHHGTKLHRFDELLDKTSPVMAVITSSDEEPADPECSELLDLKGVKHFDTRDWGTFDIIFDEEGIRKK